MNTTNNKLTLALTDIDKYSVDKVGNKAFTLGRLNAAGFPVPPTICVTAAAFRTALAPYEAELNRTLHQYNCLQPSEAHQAAENIARQLAALSVPDEVQDELHAMLPSLAQVGTALAVRSSATAEDWADHSFAGQYKSIIGACGVDAVLSAMVECWRSFFAANALVARATGEALTGQEAMALLIQPVIDAECAGVCFTVDPVRHDRDILIIDAVWGLGIGVVDGAVPADTIRIRRHKLEIDEQRIAEKDAKFVLSAHDNAKILIEKTSVDEVSRQTPCLPEAWAKRVAQFAIAIENEQHCPQDIEWAIADQQLWILQSRPVTALPRKLIEMSDFPVIWECDEDRRKLWHLARQRHPLVALEKDRTELYAAGALPDSNLLFGRPKQSVRKFFNGYPYFSSESTGMHEGDRRIRKRALARLANRLRQQGLTLWDHWGPEVIAATEELDAFDVQAADGLALAEHLENAMGAMRYHWTIHMWLWEMPSALYNEAYAKVVGQTVEESEDAASKLLEGEDNLLTKLIDGLYRLGCTARQAPAVSALIGDEELPSDILQQLATRSEAGAFYRQFQEFLRIFGARSGSGLGSGSSILKPTWREEPTLVLQLIRPYLDPTVTAPEEARFVARQARDKEIEALCDACQDKSAVAEFKHQLAVMRRELTALEDHNHYIDQMATAQLRLAAMATARWLSAKAVLASEDEIFWLEARDILKALRTQEPVPLTSLIAKRKAKHLIRLKLNPPPILGLPDAKLPKRPTHQVLQAPKEAALAPGQVRGQAASPGLVTGRARIVAMSTPIPSLTPGDILVAENAGPMWTPFFPILGGLVLDQGALTQHAAVTAREYGVPAVIRTKRATTMIPDGAWITVDGTAGTVVVQAAPS